MSWFIFSSSFDFTIGSEMMWTWLGEGSELHKRIEGLRKSPPVSAYQVKKGNEEDMNCYSYLRLKMKVLLVLCFDRYLLSKSTHNFKHDFVSFPWYKVCQEIQLSLCIYLSWHHCVNFTQNKLQWSTCWISLAITPITCKKW